ncbi:8424_t:CDS:1 [Cetraspora pellucida]|uniref:8424_t:CDS:1 n=1 Tax=Cetraspora pellucida TaxID=1433469 RepID=A0A9N9J1S9_9GLOM|nr:8424_t:CDS:1 [Cetraspora pellucida]
MAYNTRYLRPPSYPSYSSDNVKLKGTYGKEKSKGSSGKNFLNKIISQIKENSLKKKLKAKLSKFTDDKTQYYDNPQDDDLYDQPPPYDQNYNKDHTTITITEESIWTESFSIRNDATVFNIKERINTLCNIEVDNQIILHQDTILKNNNQKVNELNISPGDVLYMIRKAKVTQGTDKELYTNSPKNSDESGKIKVILPTRELELSVSSNDTVADLERMIFEKAGMEISRKTAINGHCLDYYKIHLNLVFKNKVISGSYQKLSTEGIIPCSPGEKYSAFNILFAMIKLGGG